MYYGSTELVKYGDGRRDKEKKMVRVRVASFLTDIQLKRKLKYAVLRIRRLVSLAERNEICSYPNLS
jgi:hypothetical protein